MGTALITLPDGKKAKVTFESQEQLDATVADLTAAHGAKSSTPAAGAWRGPNGNADPLSGPVGDTVLQMASGAASQAAGGVAGVARGVGAGAASLAQGEGFAKARAAFTDEAADTIEKVSAAGTYQPKTKAGQAVSGAVAKPFQWIAGKSNQAGEKVAEVTGSPALGAAVNTGIQTLAVPAALKGGSVLARGVRAAGRGAEAAEVAGAPQPPTRPGVSTGAPATPGVSRGTPAQAPGAAPQPAPAAPAPSAPPGPLSATGAPRAAPSTIGEAMGTTPPPAAPQPPPNLSASGAPRTAPSQVGEGALPPETPAGPKPAGGPSQNEAKARAYAERIGVDWARLGAGTKRALQTIAQDAGALERLSPAAVKRQAHLEGLRIPVRATRGQLTRDPAELRREAIVSRTDQGEPIRAVDVAANRDVQANLEVLRGRVAGKRGGLHEPVNEEGIPASTPSIREATKLPTEVGEAAQGALRKKAAFSKKGYGDLYEKARATEPDAQAKLSPVTDLLTENPDIQHLGWVEGWLNKAARAKAAREGGKAGEPVTLESVTLNELDDLRKLSQKHGQGTDAHYAAELRKAVDLAMEDVPEGATAWKAARDAFKKHQKEFKEQEVVRDLVSSKRGSSGRAVALEKTWAKVAKGNLEQIRTVKRSLLGGGTPELRMNGRRAWRDIRGETVNRILEDARNVVATDETERQVLTAAALQKGIKSIPRENLEELIGKKNTRELYDVLRAAKITRTQPSARVTESGTVPNALLMAEKILHHIPGGKYVTGAGKLVKQMGAAGEAGETVRRAGQSPLEEAAAQAQKTRPARRTRRQDQYRAIEETGPTLSTDLSIGTALQNRPQ